MNDELEYDLDEILKKNVEIKDFLDSLVTLHHNILNKNSSIGQSEQYDINKIRNDILICFNDLLNINQYLITFNGKINLQIKNFRKIKLKFINLTKLETALIEEKKKWQSNVPIEQQNSQITEEKNSVTINYKYRTILNKYIELVGIDNTNLNNSENEIEDRQTLLKSTTLLNLCENSLNNEINNVQLILNTLEKDLDFINNEKSIISTKLQFKIDKIDENLNRIRKKKIKLLSKVGLELPSTNAAKTNTINLTNIFTTLSIHNHIQTDSTSDLIEDDIINHAIDFIDLKINDLQEHLSFKKENTNLLLQEKNIWAASIMQITDLETKIKNYLHYSKLNSENIENEKIIDWIKNSITELNDLLNTSINENIVNVEKLINSEREVLQDACSELLTSLTDNNSSESINKNAKLDDIGIKFSEFKKPSLLDMTSTSPPKISLSEETVTFNRNVTSDSNSINDFNLNNSYKMKTLDSIDSSNTKSHKND